MAKNRAIVSKPTRLKSIRLDWLFRLVQVCILLAVVGQEQAKLLVRASYLTQSQAQLQLQFAPYDSAQVASNGVNIITNPNSNQNQNQNTNNNNNNNYQPQPPSITPFAFNTNVQENQRSSVLCTISSGDLPVSISWLKDGQLLTPQLAQAKRIIIKPDSDQSTLKFASVRLEHAGNYSCLAKNRAGQASHSAQLVVHGEPRWLRGEPMNDLISTIRAQTVVIDCQTTGWPKPEQTWLIKSEYTYRWRAPESGAFDSRPNPLVGLWKSATMAAFWQQKKNPKSQIPFRHSVAMEMVTQWRASTIGWLLSGRLVFRLALTTPFEGRTRTSGARAT